MFAETFREFMHDRNMSFNALSKSTGIPQSTISGWINRGNRPNLDDIIKIADFFGCTIDYLIGREKEDGMIIISNNSAIEFSAEEINLMHSFRKLTTRRQYKLLGYLEGLLAEQGA